MKLTYDKGTILIDGEYTTPYSKWDERANKYRATALNYKDIINYLENSDINFKDDVLDLIPMGDLSSDITLRPYQEEALGRWLSNGKGVVVMPTGAGKTFFALKLIEKVNSPTFIVVPTLDLVNQWKEELSKAFSTEIGEFTGNKKELNAITVSTYNSAYINSAYLGDKFRLLVFDEVHHLPSVGFRQIAEMFAAPLRLGLTATYEREDGLHQELPRLIGGKVYEIDPEPLAGEFLSEFETKKITVSFTVEEQAQYKKLLSVYKNYLISHNIKMRSPRDFQKLIMRTGRDPKAREALLARNRAEKLAFNSSNKLNELRKLLNPTNRTIIFTKYT
ncbi:MAG: DEAD/DEAH box helicase, partial [Candidatus Lokiarchaeota archaeon]|nr:DEAD/DEAH box helicase [Candidatus Lokiarchaeota archaeon]MBD3339320.1 DEAD/DEAH box helicase [Candidatus Lokiarchaeota archaeon]